MNEDIEMIAEDSNKFPVNIKIMRNPAETYQ